MRNIVTAKWNRFHSAGGTLLILIVLLFNLSGCSGVKKQKRQENLIYTTIEPIRFFVERVAGDAFTVLSLIPPGISPETYSPTFKQIKGIADADIYFKTGHLGFEMSDMDKIKSVNRTIKIIDCSKGLDLIAAESYVHGDHVHQSGIDPHIWLSISSAKTIALNIKIALKSRYPDKADLFEKNYLALLSEIKSVELDIDKILSTSEGSTFAIFHPALAYFAREQNIDQVAIEQEGKSPSAKHLAQLIEKSREKSINKILIQKEFNSSSAESIASEIGAQIVTIEILSYNWPEMMREIAKAVQKIE